MSTPLERADWLKERASICGVGASESAALFGLHPYLSAFALFEKLVNPKTPTDEEIEEENDVQSFGLAIEPYLADWYTRKTMRPISKPIAPQISRLPGKPFIFASPDRIVWTESPMREQGVLELKSAIYFKESEPLPDHWQIQAQSQMLCTDLPFASFAILGGFRRRYHVDDIPRNDAFCEILVETIERFMFAVQAGSWDKFGSDIDGSQTTTEALKRLYPKDSGVTVELPRVAEKWTSQLDIVKRHLKTLKTRQDQLENSLRAAIADASQGRLPDGTGWTLRTSSRAGYTVEPCEYRTLRRTTKPLK